MSVQEEQYYHPVTVNRIKQLYEDGAGMTKDEAEAIDKFVEYLIKENCEGCDLCDPRLSSEWSSCVCVEEGRAKWFLQMAENFKSTI